MHSQQAPRRGQVGLLILTVSAVLIGAIAIGAALQQSQAPVAPSAAAAIKEAQAPETGLPLLGEPEAPIWLVEFSNFSCPGCAQYHATMKQIVERHVSAGKAALVIAPMIFGEGEHPSYIAAQAALCAAKQGKFWAMSEALFAMHLARGGNSFTLTAVQQAAAELALDVEALSACIRAQETSQTIFKALLLAEQVGLRYTPSLLYSRDGGKTWNWFTQANGERYEAQVPLEVVDQLIAQR